MEVILNGKKSNDNELEIMVKALSDPNIIAEKGGFLFKSRLSNKNLSLGVIPSFLNGQRQYHYNIEMNTDSLTLVGSINPNMSITIMFKIDKKYSAEDFIVQHAEEYRQQYAVLASFLTDFSFPASVILDDISVQLINKLGISSSSCIRIIDLLSY